MDADRSFAPLFSASPDDILLNVADDVLDRLSKAMVDYGDDKGSPRPSPGFHRLCLLLMRLAPGPIERLVFAERVGGSKVRSHGLGAPNLPTADGQDPTFGRDD